MRGGVDYTTGDNLKPPLHRMLEVIFWNIRVLLFGGGEGHLDQNALSSETSAQAWPPLWYSFPLKVKWRWSSTLAYSLPDPIMSCIMSLKTFPAVCLSQKQVESSKEKVVI